MLGPGSGLGASGLVPTGSGWVALTAEGGHATMPPANDRESAVLDLMRARFDHVSAERCCPGRVSSTCTTLSPRSTGCRPRPIRAAQITDPGIGASDKLCREATEMFCAMLGTVAGNLALTLGAQGGVYIAGGIVPRLGQRFAESGFRERFEAKGRMQPYLAAVPAYVVTHRLPAFLGCAAALASRRARSGGAKARRRGAAGR